MRIFSVNLLHLLFPDFTWKIPTKMKKLFLTFDDGPHPVITSKVLNILDEYNAKATFFCVGENVKEHPEIYKEILLKGHQTGNHTYNHLKGWNTATKSYIESIQRCKQLVISDLFRPPHGRITYKQVKALKKEGYRIIMWSVLTRDYNKGADKNGLLKRAIFKTKLGSIIVFHDSEKAEENLFYLLPKFLDHYARKGYSFEPL